MIQFKLGEFQGPDSNEIYHCKFLCYPGWMIMTRGRRPVPAWGPLGNAPIKRIYWQATAGIIINTTIIPLKIMNIDRCSFTRLKDLMEAPAWIVITDFNLIKIIQGVFTQIRPQPLWRKQWKLRPSKRSQSTKLIHAHFFYQTIWFFLHIPVVFTGGIPGETKQIRKWKC